MKRTAAELMNMIQEGKKLKRKIEEARGEYIATIHRFAPPPPHPMHEVTTEDKADSAMYNLKTELAEAVLREME